MQHLEMGDLAHTIMAQELSPVVFPERGLSEGYRLCDPEPTN